jgi:hypothetical protein
MADRVYNPCTGAQDGSYPSPAAGSGSRNWAGPDRSWPQQPENVETSDPHDFPTYEVGGPPSTGDVPVNIVYRASDDDWDGDDSDSDLGDLDGSDDPHDQDTCDPDSDDCDDDDSFVASNIIASERSMSRPAAPSPTVILPTRGRPVR